MNTTEFQVISNQYQELDNLLLDSITKLELEISTDQRHKLMLYLDKLLFWNKAYNLTAIKQPKEALIKHILDCLAILPHLKSGKLLDIGTGAGLPGVVIAICEPNTFVAAVTCCSILSREMAVFGLFSVVSLGFCTSLRL